MELKGANLVVELPDGGSITFEDLGKDEFFHLIGLHYMEEQWKYLCSLMIDVKGLKYEGREITLDEFLKANISTKAMQKINNEFMRLARGELGLEDKQAAKN